MEVKDYDLLNVHRSKYVKNSIHSVTAKFNNIQPKDELTRYRKKIDVKKWSPDHE